MVTPAKLPHQALSPDTLHMLRTIDQTGSFAAAARSLGLVPSALTYRVRQLEESLDVLLFDRSSRLAKPTAAGQALLRESERLLGDLSALALRLKRIATGWESTLTIAVDSIIGRAAVMDLCTDFLALGAPTRLRLRHETLSGTLSALTSGQADVALGAILPLGLGSDLHHLPLGEVPFVYAVAPQHPLAQAAEPLSDALLQQHRAIAVADSVDQGQGLTIGLIDGQDVFTVPDMESKLQAQLRGLGGGYLPLALARPHLQSGQLIGKQTMNTQRSSSTVHAVWRASHTAAMGHALRWWIEHLQHETTRQALLS
jgi:DNA-binding transcriptional LysR family regulator